VIFDHHIMTCYGYSPEGHARRPKRAIRRVGALAPGAGLITESDVELGRPCGLPADSAWRTRAWVRRPTRRRSPVRCGTDRHANRPGPACTTADLAGPRHHSPVTFRHDRARVRAAALGIPQRIRCRSRQGAASRNRKKSLGITSRCTIRVRPCWPGVQLAGSPRCGAVGDQPADGQNGFLEVLAAPDPALQGLHCLGSAMACSTQIRAEDC
jgi:hypothetical protein